MPPRFTAVLILVALLAPPATIVEAALRAEEGRASHACCPDRLRAASCHGETIACCPPGDTSSREGTLPASSSGSHGTPLQVLSFSSAPSAESMLAALLATRLAHDAAARHAPSGPLFLKNLVLLV